jgi:hypothetical protein
MVVILMAILITTPIIIFTNQAITIILTLRIPHPQTILSYSDEHPTLSRVLLESHFPQTSQVGKIIYHSFSLALHFFVLERTKSRVEMRERSRNEKVVSFYYVVQ